MNVKELIVALLNEDMDSSVYVRIVNNDGDVVFMDVDGIALENNSYKPTKEIVCPTLLCF